jgi:hypothetical protein
LSEPSVSSPSWIAYAAAARSISAIAWSARQRNSKCQALDQLPLAHHPQHPLAVDRDPEPAPHERRHHPVAVGLVVAGDLDNRRLDRVGRRCGTVRGVGTR